MVWLGEEEKQTTLYCTYKCGSLWVVTNVFNRDCSLFISSCIFYYTSYTWIQFLCSDLTSLPSYSWLFTCPFLFLFRITFFGKSYLLFWMNFCHRLSKWMCLWGFRNGHKVYRFMWDIWVPFKKEMEKEAKKIILDFAFNSRVWGSSEDSMGKVLIIALYVTYYPWLFNFPFKYLY